MTHGANVKIINGKVYNLCFSLGISENKESF